MIGDSAVVDTDYHQLVDFIIRRCSSDQNVFRQAYVVHGTSLETYRAQLLDLRILISDIAASFTFPVYIRKSITDIPKEHSEEPVEEYFATSDRPTLMPEHFNFFVKVIIRKCDTDERVFEDSFFIQAETRADYQFWIADLHEAIYNIVFAYTYPVYVNERITELHGETPRAQRLLQ